MRKYLFLFLFLFGILPQIVSAACDESFERPLRVGHSYRFNDSLTAHGNSVWVDDSTETFYAKEHYSNGADPVFNWTNFTNPIDPFQTVRILQATDYYTLDNAPSSRPSQYGDISITYETKYWEWFNNKWNGPYYHTECMNYMLTWCGDGILQTADGETCDPADSNHGGWGQYGCSATCTPIDTPPSSVSCLSLGVNVAPNNIPATATGTCTGSGFVNPVYHFNVTDPLVNPVIPTVTGNIMAHSINQVGTYSGTCLIDGQDAQGNAYWNITSPGCTAQYGVGTSNSCADTNADGIYDQCNASGTGPDCTTVNDCLTATGCNVALQCVAGGTLGNCTTSADCPTVVPTCQALSVVDASTGIPIGVTTIPPVTALCTCTATPAFSTPGFGIDRYDFNMTGANTGSATINTGALSASWPHLISNTGATNVTCVITGHDAQGNSINTAGQPNCTTGFNINPNNPLCGSLVNTGTISQIASTYSRTFTCNADANWTTGTVVSLDCGNNSQVFSTSTGSSITGTCDYARSGSSTNFRATCRVGGTSTTAIDANCDANTTLRSSGGGGGGGGWNPACNLTSPPPFATFSTSGNRTTVQFGPLIWNYNQSTQPILTFSGAYPLVVLNIDHDIAVNQTLTGNLQPPYPITRTASGTITYEIPDSGTGGVQLSFGDPGVNANCGSCCGPTSYCGDGRIDPLLGEMCDDGTNNGTSNSNCSSDCKVVIPLTNPGEIGFIYTADRIVGKNVRVFRSNGEVFYHIRPSDHPQIAYYPYTVCIENTSSIVAGNGHENCVDSSPNPHPSGSNLLCSSGPIGWVSQDINQSINAPVVIPGLSTTYLGRGISSDKDDTAKRRADGTLDSKFNFLLDNEGGHAVSGYDTVKDDQCRRVGWANIRVVKSIVSNTSGGNAYNPKGVSLNSVTAGFIDNLKKGNFTTSAKGTGDWSLTKTSTNTSSTNTVNTIKNTTVTGNSEILGEVRASSLVTGTTSLGDNANVRVVQAGKNLRVDSSWDLEGVKTVIIEKGDLYIDKDIQYKAGKLNASWAFIVKNGDIKIKGTVKNIAGVFMTLNGNIMASDGDSAIQLRVDGSFYGNPDNLVQHRTYVYGTASSSALATGVVINYSNRALKFPPPMLTNFIETYKLKKVSK